MAVSISGQHSNISLKIAGDRASKPRGSKEGVFIIVFYIHKPVISHRIARQKGAITGEATG